MKSPILHQSRFKPLSDGHGGNRRTSQIIDLIKQSGLSIQIVHPDQSGQPKRLTRIQQYWAGIRAMIRYRLNLPAHYKIIRKYGYQYLSYKNTLKQFQEAKILIWEETINYITPNIARQGALKILALPQNLESLASAQAGPAMRQHLSSKLAIEVEQLSKADAIFCISREEQWLLRLWGIEARFLPYYPPEKILKSLKKIRKDRILSEKNFFLIVGTIYNPPTRIGIVEQIEWLEELRKKVKFKINVVGYGTDELSDLCKHPDFRLLGKVSDERLHHLMAGAKAVLIHQRAGVGALTRIPEMLIAGIPVIANGNACRSAFTYKGVYCYDTQVELQELMKTTLSTPEIPLPPTAAQEDFISQLKFFLSTFQIN